MKWNRRAGTAAVLIVIVILSLNVRIPYYMTQPGSAINLGSIIEVEGGYREEERGHFRITTVRMGPTTVAGFLYGVLVPYVDVVKAETVHSPHETNEDYTRRQLEVMKASQDTSKIVAFQKAGYDIQVKNGGAIVMMLIPDFPAAKHLKVGDVIVGVDGQTISTAAELIDSMKGRKAGESVTIAYLRNGERREAVLTLKPLPVKNEEGVSKPGIGIASPITLRQFDLPKEVTIKAENIGGPSAGLLFTLEIMNQLTKEDLTKGYNIAGSGTIDEKGAVGRIGGIHHKVVAAHRENVEIFFAPDDAPDERSSEPSNYEQALAVAKDLDTDMKIVPVRTIDDALDYLKNLPEK